MAKAKWEKIEGEDGCGYKYTQHVLKSKTVSAKLWSRYDDEIEYTFDTDGSPGLTGKIQSNGLNSRALLSLGKRFIENTLLPRHRSEVEKKRSRRMLRK